MKPKLRRKPAARHKMPWSDEELSRLRKGLPIPDRAPGSVYWKAVRMRREMREFLNIFDGGRP